MALTRILCARLWNIAPVFTPAEPDLQVMLARNDAALVIGDPALAIDTETLGRRSRPTSARRGRA